MILNDRLLKEISIYIFLIHGSEYIDVKGHHGYLVSVRGKNNILAISMTEGMRIYLCMPLPSVG